MNQDVECISLVNEASAIANLVRIYPNPVNEGNAVVAIAVKKAAVLSIQVFDVTGKLIQNKVQNQSIVGQINYTIEGLNKAGVYFIKVKINNQQQTTRLIKL